MTTGHGVLDWMGQVGARAASPLTLLREHTTACGGCSPASGSTSTATTCTLDGVALDWPPPRPPLLLVGARGPKTLRLAGEVADGVLLDSVTDPDTVRRGREGRRRAATPRAAPARST